MVEQQLEIILSNYGMYLLCTTLDRFITVVKKGKLFENGWYVILRQKIDGRAVSFPRSNEERLLTFVFLPNFEFLNSLHLNLKDKKSGLDFTTCFGI
jgi:hypothetical protein